VRCAGRAKAKAEERGREEREGGAPRLIGRMDMTRAEGVRLDGAVDERRTSGKVPLEKTLRGGQYAHMDAAAAEASTALT
jgi:hypothetical protein